MTKAGKSLVNRDRMNQAPRKAIASLTVRIFDRIQDYRKEHQLLALAAAFVLLCEAARIPAQDVFSASSNLMVDSSTSSGRALEFQAMKHHLETELLEEEGR